jgi:hypothetical protein
MDDLHDVYGNKSCEVVRVVTSPPKIIDTRHHIGHIYSRHKSFFQKGLAAASSENSALLHIMSSQHHTTVQGLQNQVLHQTQSRKWNHLPKRPVHCHKKKLD